jgi:hypothetical protein
MRTYRAAYRAFDVINYLDIHRFITAGPTLEPMDALIAGPGSILRNRIGIARNGAGGLDTATISVVRRETPQSMALFNKEDSDIVN